MTAAPRPFRLTPFRPSEYDLHTTVATALDLLLMPPAEWTTFPAGHSELSGQAAAKLARLGLKRNWPDILVVHRGIFGIELKRPGGALSRTRMVRTRRGGLRMVEGQREGFPRLEAAGMPIAVCDSIDAVLRALVSWGVPVRSAGIKGAPAPVTNSPGKGLARGRRTRPKLVQVTT